MQTSLDGLMLCMRTHGEVALEDGVYMVDTREIIAGPPQGTVTFDDRPPGTMGHCV
jgi:hypothetical protein